ncbi:DsbA family oxidoreductase [Calidifontibacter indicus]|uniref:Putative DsbA family dithiol-disulfide isomerase n=1 Tax=Calidifontibacter indicus TaxID=419650 RepID=A0A3D9V4A6_9MICO|nr:DsbA family oxidoreductase [Calidifontibacter indicus]REF32001.1 putative DsbA family dithiol-disulfide isomerase [Calidifontibacter indicus]
MNVDIWSDLACPWCFIGTERFHKALAEFEGKDDVKVIWHSFQLDPELPDHYDGTEVDYLAASKGMPRDQVEAMTDQVAGVAAGDGLNFDFAGLKVANSRLAHHLVHLAQLRGVAAPVSRGLFSAHFENAEDIGDRAVLTRIGVENGLEESDIAEALGSPAYDTAMRSDAAQAQGIGINGVPFFVVDGRFGVSGAQPVETFGKALAMAFEDAPEGGGGCCGGSCCS